MQNHKTAEIINTTAVFLADKIIAVTHKPFQISH